MHRGEIWWASLPDPMGSEPGFNRPVVVVQDDLFNEINLRTVIVAAITSNLRRADAPGNVRLEVRDSKLAHPSVVNVTQLFTIDKTKLIEYVNELPFRVMVSIDSGLRYVLGLGSSGMDDHLDRS
jgi:mRNA interferase MazF